MKENLTLFKCMNTKEHNFPQTSLIQELYDSHNDKYEKINKSFNNYFRNKVYCSKHEKLKFENN